MTEQLALGEVAEDRDIEQTVVDPRFRSEREAEAAVRPVVDRDHEGLRPKDAPVEAEIDGSRSITEEHPEQAEDRAEAPAVARLALGEDRGIETDRDAFIEGVAVGLADVDRSFVSRGDDRCGRI